ncbi:MAG TPA: hypothetical protein VLL54_17835 [Pyrinomonadaceae bacterium]|nr:hypothetical protein [Pyrinomonadaceae bacterium]
MDPQAPLQKKLNLDRLESIRRYLKYGAAVFAVLFVGLIALSLYRLDRAIVAKRAEFSSIELAIKDKQLEIEQQKKESEKLAEKIKTQNAALDVYRSKPIDAEQAKQLKTAVELTTVPTNVTQLAFSIPARIYLQISGPEQMEFAEKIAKNLQSKGYVVPGIEDVGNKVPNESDLRYYAGDDVTLKDVREIQANCKEWGLVLTTNQLNSSSARPRHYEIWLGKNVGTKRRLEVNPILVRPVHP